MKYIEESHRSTAFVVLAFILPEIRITFVGTIEVKEDKDDENEIHTGAFLNRV